MGTTLTALQSGRVAVQSVLAIEGFSNLITNGATARAVTAWAGTAYSAAIKGLFIEGTLEQVLEWRTPIRPIGTMTFYVHPGKRGSAAYDLLGTAVHKRDGGFETLLTSKFAPGDTTMNVVSTTGSPAAPGEVFLGNSCIGYTGKTATTFTGCTSKYVPVGTLGDDTVFRRNHRVSTFDFHARLQPVVSTLRQTWEGAWVTLTMHRRLGDVLDVKAQAQRLFAGRIVEIRQDSRTGMIVITAQHVVDYLAETTLLQDQFTGRAREGHYLRAGLVFSARDQYHGASAKNANVLKVVAASPGTNEILAGWYTLAELLDALNSWLSAEKIATRLYGTYTFAAPVESNQGPRTSLKWRIDGTDNTTPANFTIDLNPGVGHFLGFFENQNSGSEISGGDYADTNNESFSPFEPFRVLLRSALQGGLGLFDLITLEATSGEFVSQTALLPQEAADYAQEAAGSWGLFVVDGFIVIAHQVSATEFDYVRPVLSLNEGWSTNILTDFYNVNFGRRVTDDTPLEMKQIFVLEGAPKLVINAILASTGTTNYNDDGNGYDILGAALGMAIPYGLLSEAGSNHAFADSIGQLPEGGDAIRVWIKEPKKFRELFSGDLIIRRAHLVWRNGSLRVTTWPTPDADHAVHTLNESNKAAPTDTTDANPSDMVYTDEGIANIITFKYSRDFATDTYQDRRVCEDPPSIDAFGGRRFEVQMPNIHGDTVGDLIDGFMSTMPQISRPFWQLLRTIDFRFFENVAPGDVAIVTDKLARNITTGGYGITNRPAVILKHKISWGGAVPTPPGAVPKALPPIGEVALAFQNVDRTVPYSPAAMVDETANGGGFTAGYNGGTNTLRTKPHRYSHTSDPVDAVPFQTAGRKLRILELDPTGGVSDSWDRDSNGGTVNDVVLSSGLAAPAFDANKRYVIVPQPYASADSVQKSKAFQADDADLQIQDLRAAYHYGNVINVFSKLVVHTDLPERYSSSSHGDGVALDVGHEHGLALLLNNQIDHRTAFCGPFLDNTIRAASDRSPPASTDYSLIFCRRIYVGPHKMPNGMTRKLEVGPWARASSASASKVRVTISRFPPTENPLYGPGVNVVHSSPKSQAEWTGITSTSWTELTAAGLDIRVASAGGWVWQCVELTNVAQTRGLSRNRLKARNEA